MLPQPCERHTFRHLQRYDLWRVSNDGPMLQRCNGLLKNTDHEVESCALQICGEAHRIDECRLLQEGTLEALIEREKRRNFVCPRDARLLRFEPDLLDCFEFLEASDERRSFHEEPNV